MFLTKPDFLCQIVDLKLELCDMGEDDDKRSLTKQLQYGLVQDPHCGLHVHSEQFLEK